MCNHLDLEHPASTSSEVTPLRDLDFARNTGNRMKSQEKDDLKSMSILKHEPQVKGTASHYDNDEEQGSPDGLVPGANNSLRAIHCRTIMVDDTSFWTAQGMEIANSIRQNRRTKAAYSEPLTRTANHGKCYVCFNAEVLPMASEKMAEKGLGEFTWANAVGKLEELVKKAKGDADLRRLMRYIATAAVLQDRWARQDKLVFLKTEEDYEIALPREPDHPDLKSLASYILNRITMGMYSLNHSGVLSITDIFIEVDIWTLLEDEVFKKYKKAKKKQKLL